jgi:hypothetical protein
MRLWVVVLVVLLAGCSGVVPTDEPTADGGTPDGDIGVEDGVGADESLPITTDDGLNETELDLVVARMMARVETIRGLEFEREVPVEVISRETFRDRGAVGGGEADPVAERLHEAAFLVCEDQTVGEARGEVYGQSVLGYYNGSHIVIVTDDTDGVRISRATLAHELTHALQDQHFSLAPAGRSHDARLAAQGIVEGDANYVEFAYERRCGDEWECIPPVESSGGGGGPGNVGLYLAVFTPYSEGPELIAALRERGGWAAVNDAFADKPVSTEQVIHPERYPDEEPVDVGVPDRSGEAWRRAGEGRSGDTIGEGTLYAGLWVNGAIPESNLREGGDDLSPYSYDHPATEGWAGDRVVAYTNGSASGYVFKSTWDSTEDAEQFQAAYVDVIEANGGREVRDGVYRIPENSSFGDAFRVVRQNRTVVVVNAPTVGQLDAVHDVDGQTDAEADDGPVGLSGAGSVAAGVAVVVVVLALARRRDAR